MMTAQQTFQYAYLHLINSRHLGGIDRPRWIGIVLDSMGPTLHDEIDDSGLIIMNKLGRDGWVISDGPAINVDNNEIPNYLNAVLISRYGELGIIRVRQRHFMTRALVEPKSTGQGWIT